MSFAFLWLHLKHAPPGNIMAVALGAVLSYAALAFVAPLLMGAMGWNRVGTDQQFLIWVVAAVLWGRIILPFLNGYAVVRVTPGRAMTACVLLAVFRELILLTYWAHAMSQGHTSPMARDWYWLNLIPAALMLTGGALLRRVTVRA